MITRSRAPNAARDLALDEHRRGVAAGGVDRAERDWLPISNPLCPLCPLYQRGWSPYDSPDDGPDAMGWLEGTA